MSSDAAASVKPAAPTPPKGKRTNGSKRRAKRTHARPPKWQSWQQQGITIATLNIAGLTLAKLFLLLAQHSPDVLCLQETWLTPTAEAPTVTGYRLLERRRASHSRGGIAHYICQEFRILHQETLDFAIWA